MPDRDVLAAIGEKSERLLRQAMESVEICQVFAAAMGVLQDTAIEKGARSISIGRAGMTGKRIIALAQFSKLVMPQRVIEKPEQTSSFLAWAKQDAKLLYSFMISNPDTLQYLADLVRFVEAYARHKGKKFEEIKFCEVPAPFLDRDGYLVIEISDERETRSWMDKLSGMFRAGKVRR